MVRRSTYSSLLQVIVLITLNSKLADIMHQHKWVEDDFIGIDHLDKTTKRVNEKAVFISN
jgi:hypothetical protein